MIILKKIYVVNTLYKIAQKVSDFKLFIAKKTAKSIQHKLQIGFAVKINYFSGMFRVNIRTEEREKTFRGLLVLTALPLTSTNLSNEQGRLPGGKCLR